MAFTVVLSDGAMQYGNLEQSAGIGPALDMALNFSLGMAYIPL